MASSPFSRSHLCTAPLQPHTEGTHQRQRERCSVPNPWLLMAARTLPYIPLPLWRARRRQDEAGCGPASAAAGKGGKQSGPHTRHCARTAAPTAGSSAAATPGPARPVWQMQHWTPANLTRSKPVLPFVLRNLFTFAFRTHKNMQTRLVVRMYVGYGTMARKEIFTAQVLCTQNSGAMFSESFSVSFYNILWALNTVLKKTCKYLQKFV